MEFEKLDDQKTLRVIITSFALNSILTMMRNRKILRMGPGVIIATFALGSLLVIASGVTVGTLAIVNKQKKVSRLKNEIENYVETKPNYTKLIEQTNQELRSVASEPPIFSLQELQRLDSLKHQKAILLKEQKQAAADIRHFTDSLQVENRILLGKKYIARMRSR